MKDREARFRHDGGVLGGQVQPSQSPRDRFVLPQLITGLTL